MTDQTTVTVYGASDDLIEIAAPRFRDGRVDAWADVVPLYLRRTDAEIAWDARGATA